MMVDGTKLRNKAAAIAYKTVNEQIARYGKDKPVCLMPLTCKGCGHCCGRTLPMSGLEIKRIKTYIKQNGIKPRKASDKRTGIDNCAFLNDNNECMIYEVRPYICNVWESPYHKLIVHGNPCGVPIECFNEFIHRFKSLWITDTWTEFD